METLVRFNESRGFFACNKEKMVLWDELFVEWLCLFSNDGGFLVDWISEQIVKVAE